MSHRGVCPAVSHVSISPEQSSTGLIMSDGSPTLAGEGTAGRSALVGLFSVKLLRCQLIRPCDVASGVASWNPCYSQTFNIGASLYLIP